MTEENKLEELHVFLLQHNDGVEGLASVHNGEEFVPMVAGDETRLGRLKGMAQSLSDAHGIPIVCAKFSRREDVESYVPRTVN